MSQQEQEKVLVWVHGDRLDPAGEALQAYPDAPAVFVFDQELLAQYRLSFKRVVFLYECLLEIEDIQIRKGDVADELALVAAELNCSRIVTVNTVAPRFAEICQKLRQEKKLPVEIIEPEPFIELDKDEAEELDLKRFSRYWQAVSGRALSLKY